MIYVVTGHKNGLGSAIANNLLYYKKNQYNQVIGYDIADGYDIGETSTIGKIVWQSKNADVFINNAYDQFGQTQLLRYFIKMWKGNTSKLIVNIGSFLVNQDNLNLGLFNKDEILYIEQKKEQKKLIDQHRVTDSKLKIIQVNPGLLDTKFTYTLGGTLPDNCQLHTAPETAQIIVNLIDAAMQGLYTKEITLNNLTTNEY